MLYLGVCDTHEAQLKVLEALTRKFARAPGLDLAAVAARCPFTYTGADFYALCSDAMLKAMTRKAQEIDEKIGEKIRMSDAKVLAHLGPHLKPKICKLSRPEQPATSLHASTPNDAAVLSGGDGHTRRNRCFGFIAGF